MERSFASGLKSTLRSTPTTSSPPFHLEPLPESSGHGCVENARFAARPGESQVFEGACKLAVARSLLLSGAFALLTTAFVEENPMNQNSPTPETPPMPPKKKRGFASMDPNQVRELARRGGVAAHRAGTAHEFSSEEARAAGRKGGLAAHSGDRKRNEEEQGQGQEEPRQAS
jgi:uncharacterized protein